MPSNADRTPAAYSRTSPQRITTETHHSGGGENVPPDLRVTVGSRMSKVMTVCALTLCVLATPAAVGAQEGSGPYAPSPSAPADGAGDAWYARMDADFPPALLADGAFVGVLSSTGGFDAAPSARAGVGVGGTAMGELLAALALGSAAAAVAVVLRRREPT